MGANEDPLTDVHLSFYASALAAVAFYKESLR